MRPHDLEILRGPNGTPQPAVVEGLVHLGFEVRVSLLLEDGSSLTAQLTRDEAQVLGIESGTPVFVRPRTEPRFAAADAPPVDLEAAAPAA